MRSVAVFFLLFVLASGVCSLGMNLNPSEENGDQLVKCLHLLLKKYFHSGESLSGSVLFMSLIGDAVDLESGILQALHMDPDNFWSIVVRHSNREPSSTVTMHEKPQTYFVLLENLDEDNLLDTFDDWKAMPNWNSQAQFLVFLSSIEETEAEMTEIMTETMLFFLSRKIYNINVIAQTEEDGRVYSKTTFPYEHENNCGTRAIAYHTLDTCEFGENGEATGVRVEEHKRGLFLDKIPKDLSGCPLVAFSRSWEPYMFIEDGRMKGIEWMLVQTIGECLHIDIKVVIQNRTLFHMFQGLLNQKADILIGGLDEDPNLSHLMSATAPYLQDDLTWCVVKAKKALHWLNFLHVLSPGTYAMYIAFVSVNALVIHTIQRWLHVRRTLGKGLPSLLIILFGIAWNQSVGAVDFTPSLRICLTMALLVTLLIGNVYNSFMVSSLTSPSSLRQIKKAIEIFERKMSVTGSVDIIRHLDKETDVFRYIRQEFIMCYNMEECLQRAAIDPNLAVAISRQYSLHNPRIPRDKLYCFDRDENIYSYLVTMLMPKKFHLFHHINPIIQYVIESGHLLKWTRDIVMEHQLKTNRRSDEGGAQVLKVAQISGIFAFASIFLVLSCIVIAVEIYVHRAYTRGTRVKIIKYLHKCFS